MVSRDPFPEVRRSNRATIHWLVALGLMAAFPGCTELLVDPAPQSGAVLSLALAAPSSPAATVGSGDPEAASAGSAAAAFDQADAVRILLLRGGTAVADLERSFAPEGSETRIRVEVELGEDQETLQLQVILAWQRQVLFEAARSVTLRTSESTEAEVVLQPVPAGVKVPQSPVVLEALGEQAQLPGAVVFATGDPVPGLSLTWSTTDTDVMSVSSDGVVTALALGEGQAIGAYEDFAETLTVAVTQAVASVTVEPSQVEVPINGIVQLAATLQDFNGNHIADEERTVTWSSSDPQIASVDGDGQVTGHETGEVAVTATAEGISGLATVTVLESGDPVDFPDSNLESVIREAIGKPEGEISTSDLAQITSLTANDSGISELAGLEYLTNLTSLSLRDNEITDLTPLQGLTGLTILWLDRNSVSDLSPIQGLTGLTNLRLNGNSISDLTPLQGLAQLTHLILNGNSISDITPVEGLTSLTWLTLFFNSISDITPLQGLTELTRLDLFNNSVSDLAPLEGLTALTSLNVGANPVSDLTPLQGLVQLTFLSVNAGQVTDITPLQGLTALTRLWLHFGNSISDITPLQGLVQLTDLRLQNNQITDLQALVDNEGLGSGDEVQLEGNPLGQQALCDQIPALQGRGVDVSFTGTCG